MNYMTTEELRQIAKAIDQLEDIQGGDISFGPIRVFDSNGEVLGTIDTAEFGGLAFRAEHDDA